MISYCLDSDAFNWLRKLASDGESLLDLLLRCSARTPVLLGDWVARRELIALQSFVQAHERARRIIVKSAKARDPLYKALRATVDKGEAEALCVILAMRPDERPVFVTCDRDAQKEASRRKVRCTDALGVAVDLVQLGMHTSDAAEIALAPWADPVQQLGRPRDWIDFSKTFAARTATGFPYM